MDLLFEEILIYRTPVRAFPLTCISIVIDTHLGLTGWAKEESARGIIGWFARFSA
jgi:hypothetical protein